MSKRKSFSSNALNTLTGAPAPTQTTPSGGENKTIDAKPKVVVEKKEKAPQIAKKQASEHKQPQRFGVKSTERTGKPVTLYLNTVNYEAFKLKAKAEKRTASNLINEFIAGYIAE